MMKRVNEVSDDEAILNPRNGNNDRAYRMKSPRQGFSLVSKIKAAWRLICDPEAPRMARLVVIGALVYLISPVDFLPDTIPVLGWIDDVIAVFAAYKGLASRLGDYEA